MSTPLDPPTQHDSHAPDTPKYGQQGTDEDFLERQFRMSVEALERAHALAPGEFDDLISTQVRTDEERRQRAEHHERIARRALVAAQKRMLSEEEFNIWSGRRKEHGQPVKAHFEEAYTRACTPSLSCKRGALTGIVRAYVRLQDDLIADLIAAAEVATTAKELLEVEQEAIRYGFLELETYTQGDIAGWPCFPRSTGRFRGATRLRQFFEQRQTELPLPADLAADICERLSAPLLQSSEQLREQTEEYQLDQTATLPLQRFLRRISNLFR